MGRDIGAARNDPRLDEARCPGGFEADGLAADLGIVPELEPRPDHASYLASWLEILKNEKRFIFAAAAHAQRAVNYLHDLQPAITGEREAA